MVTLAPVDSGDRAANPWIDLFLGAPLVVRKRTGHRRWIGRSDACDERGEFGGHDV